MTDDFLIVKLFLIGSLIFFLGLPMTASGMIAGNYVETWIIVPIGYLLCIFGVLLWITSPLIFLFTNEVFT